MSLAARALPTFAYGPVVDPDLARARILVVDDSEALRKTIGIYLRHGGYRDIHEAAGGEEALAAADELSPDLIITDLLMPGMDGLELCRCLRASEQHAHVPVLIQTARANGDDRGDVFSHGATDLISKPINAREMLGRVRVHLEQRQLVNKLTKYQAMMAEDLDLARQMQESILPTPADLASLEAAFPIEIASSYRASLGLGGDLWGISVPGENQIGIYLADFTGHGVAAALNTFRFHSILRDQHFDGMPLSEAMSSMNDFLADTLPTGQFSTMLAFRIDFDDNTIEFSSASGPPPLLRFGPEGDFEPIVLAGFPLGIIRDASYATRKFPFPPGSAALFYSDALIETPQAPHSVYSPETLNRTLLQARSNTADAMRDVVLTGLIGHELEDDLTLIAIRRKEG
jgi:sigma-B regulation protein RsbU (phosphoserine phosphatase)